MSLQLVFQEGGETVKAEPKIPEVTKPRNRSDLVADIATYTSGLHQIQKCACDSIKDRDIPAIVDCIHKFYTGYGVVSAAIMSYGSVLEADEILRYITTMAEIEREFKTETAKLAKEYR
jgi:hypothetical protein